VPIPPALMLKLKRRMKTKRAHPRDLVFPNSEGRPQGHFLRMHAITGEPVLSLTGSTSR